MPSVANSMPFCETMPKQPSDMIAPGASRNVAKLMASMSPLLKASRGSRKLAANANIVSPIKSDVLNGEGWISVPSQLSVCTPVVIG